MKGGPGSYAMKCFGAMEGEKWELAQWIMGAWLFGGAFAAYSIYTRGLVEDRALREEFGRKWDEYAKRVPYRYFPGLI